MERILITGAHGFVGARAMMAFPNATAFPSELLRAANAEAILAFVGQAQPTHILHTAAISDIGVCEQNPDASYQANVVLTETLARSAAQVGAKLVAFSSDQVYTGCVEDGPYRESDPLPEPTNVYARHKLEAERRTLDILPDAVLLRATWMYDMPLYDHPNRGNFLVNALKALAAGRKLPVAARLYRGITYVRQVAELLARAAELPGGVYNYGSENDLNAPDTAKALLDALGLGTRGNELVEIQDEAYHNLWMNCDAIKRHGICFDSTAEGFKRCVRDYSLSFGESKRS